MAKWNKDFKSIKYKGMLFTEWCKVNGFEYMIDELDEDYSRENFVLDLSNLTHGNDKNLRWSCSNTSHPSFMAKTIHRTSGQRLTCPYCNGHWLTLSEHSVAVELKHLLHEWDYLRNTVSPEEVTTGTTTKYWWICSKCKNSYQSSAHHRKEGRGCPYCANLKIKKGFNDLGTTHPHLVKEWDFEKNTISPYEISYGYDKKVYWICPNCSKSYQAPVINRTYANNGCPKCAALRYTSFPEQALLYYINIFFTNISSRDKTYGVEYDILFRDEKITIEYNDRHWHDGKESLDAYKMNLAISNGYYPIVINADRTLRGTELSMNTNNYFTIITCYCDKIHPDSVTIMVRSVLQLIFTRLGISFSRYDLIDVKRDTVDIMKKYK